MYVVYMQLKVFHRTPPKTRKVSRSNNVLQCSDLTLSLSLSPSLPPFLKVIVATNIAETSVTIAGIVHGVYMYTCMHDS